MKIFKLQKLLCWVGLIQALFFFLFAVNARAEVVALKSIHGPDSNQTWKLVFESKSTLAPHYSYMTHPNRLVLEIKKVGLFQQQIKPNLLSGTPIIDIRAAEHSGDMRIVFDLRAPIRVKAVMQHGGTNGLQQLIINLQATALITTVASPSIPNVRQNVSQNDTKINRTSQINPINPISPTPTVVKRVIPVSASASVPAPIKQHFNFPSSGVGQIRMPYPGHPSAAPVHPIAQQSIISPNQLKPTITADAIQNSQSSRRIVLVIDPGHGGKDPGATGLHGIEEKNVVLNISKKLAALLNQQPGFHAILTRSGDYFLPLRQRLNIARTNKADMFIAIHADAYRDQIAHGVSVFALSQRGATSEAARWLAQRENESELMGGVDLSNQEDVLKSVLINLSQTATIRASLLMGEDLLGCLHQCAYLHHKRVEQAAFVVLKSPDIPSVLVETGFMSNAKEGYYLSNSGYEQRMAQALMLGIQRYFLMHSPPGTWVATHHAVH